MSLNFLIVRQPYILAHRGASGYAPENTFEAFDRSIAMRSDGIETDIRATKDGTLVLMHDARVDRTTTGEGLVSELLAEDVARLDAGGGFNPRYSSERVPLLSAFLAKYGRRLPLCLEIKQPGIESAVLEAVRNQDLLFGPAPTDVGGAETMALPFVTFSSFHFDSCVAIKKIAPDAVVGFLTPDFDDITIARVAKAKLDQICPRADTCTPAQVATARDRNLGIRAWGVADREVLRSAMKCGIDGITCNWPDWTVGPTR